MKKSMIVWVPIDILYRMEADNFKRLYRELNEDGEYKDIVNEDIFEKIDEEFIAEKLNQ